MVSTPSETSPVYHIDDSFRPFKEIRSPGSGEILFVESGVVGFGIRNSARGIRNPTNKWNPESTFH